MTLNPDVIRARCGEIEESVQRLEALAVRPLPEFLADRDAQDIACYRLLIAIEAALALCYHVSSRRLHVTPESYADCFAVLGDAGLLPPDLAPRLQRMAKFRKLLVHVYWDVDYRRVHEAIRENLGDLRAFATAMVALV